MGLWPALTDVDMVLGVKRYESSEGDEIIESKGGRFFLPEYPKSVRRN